jgi:hypothetical protein
MPCYFGFCYGTPPACQVNSCYDGVKDDTETDVDCGGGACVAAGQTCPYNARCQTSADCKSGLCTNFGTFSLCQCATSADCPPGNPRCGAQFPGICSP